MLLFEEDKIKIPFLDSVPDTIPNLPLNKSRIVKFEMTLSYCKIIILLKT